MKKVLVRGPIINSAGYGVHARQVFDYLKSREDCKVINQVLPWGICTFYLNEDYENGLIGKAINSSISSHQETDVSFQIQLPNEWDPSISKINVGITAGVETDRCNPEWIEKINAMDLVIVPSNHTKKCFENSGNIKTRLEVVPEYIQPAILEEKLDPMQLDIETKFNFLMFGLITGGNPETDRKNTFYGIKWLCETFKEDSEVGVILKTSLGRMTVMDRYQTLEMIKKLISEVRVGPYPKFYLSHGLMTDHEVSSFYRSPQINALVSFTRGEGYGLPILEAASSGLPVMATKWSGHMDFMRNIKFSGFDYSLEEINESRVDDNIFMKGSKWANPKEDDVKRRLKKIKSSYDVPLDWADKGKSYLRESLSKESVFKIYDNVLQDILL